MEAGAAQYKVWPGGEQTIHAGNLVPFEESINDGKMDYLINVIVGGTGAYEGATGMLLGRTPGKGPNTEVAEDVTLPVSILKLMEGYIKIPLKEEGKTASPVW